MDQRWNKKEKYSLLPAFRKKRFSTSKTHIQKRFRKGVSRNFQKQAKKFLKKEIK
jgi:hypothetical protein